MKKSIFIPILLVLALFLILGLFLKFGQNPYDFSLKSSFKEQTTLKDFKGKKLIVYFGFTFCPDICPATLSLISKFLKQNDHPNAHLLFISLDLNRDSNINSTNEWLRYFYPKADALIAKDEKTLQNLAKKYKIIYEKIALKDSALEYSIAHSNVIFLIDERGHFYKELNDLNPSEVFKELRIFLSSK